MGVQTERAAPEAGERGVPKFGFAERRPALAPRFGMVTVNRRSRFFSQLAEGARIAAAKAGIELEIFDAHGEAAEQVAAIEQYIQREVQGIVVVAIDVQEVMPAVRAAAAAGIPVVAADAILPPGMQRAQICVDNATMSGMIGRYFLDHVAGAGGGAEVGIITALNAPNQIVRWKGFEAVVKDRPGVTLAGMADGQDRRDVAAAAAESLLAGHPDITALYATGEVALRGAIEAVKRREKQEIVRLFGWDLTAQAIEGIDAGYVVAVAHQDPASIGASAVNVLARATRGDPVEHTVVSGVTIVTKANVDPYRALFE